MPKCKNDPKKSYSGNEPSPKGLGWCAHAEKVGIIKKGNDGNQWIIKSIGNSKRWIKHGKKNIKKKIDFDDIDLKKIINVLSNKFIKWWKILAEGGIMVVYKNGKYDILASKKSSGKAKIKENVEIHKQIGKDNDVKYIVWSNQSYDTIEMFTFYILEKTKNEEIEKILKSNNPINIFIDNFKKYFEKYELYPETKNKDYTLKGIDGDNEKIVKKIAKSEILSKYL